MNKILVIDHFDSFIYNLVHEFEKRDCETEVYRSNTGMEVINSAIDEYKPDLITLSPGPSHPKQAGNFIKIIKAYHEKIPIFGVCLGCQAIIEAFGGKVDEIEPMHGKPSLIYHDGKTMYKGLENPFRAGRYHSLVGMKMPKDLEISATTEDGLVMGVRHTKYPIEGVQFHPESILTPHGGKIIENIMQYLKK
jgi:anthranilate synthase/aminodeoxychorismate synthase-like glutamine amidotransferase